MISHMSLYNLSIKGKNFKINRLIPIKDIDAITVTIPEIRSEEILFHVSGDYDYRYDAGRYKKDIILLLRNIVNL